MRLASERGQSPFYIEETISPEELNMWILYYMKYPDAGYRNSIDLARIMQMLYVFMSNGKGEPKSVEDFILDIKTPEEQVEYDNKKMLDKLMAFKLQAEASMKMKETIKNKPKEKTSFLRPMK